jgi:hypothetical protein
MSSIAHDHAPADDTGTMHAHDAHGPPGGIMRWITTTNHKTSARLPVFPFTMFIWRLHGP